MRQLIPVLVMMATACNAVNSQLQNAIAHGEIKELNDYSVDVDKQLLLRLFQAPLHREACFIETHGVCQYQYFLAASTFDEFPETKIFELQTVGEVVGVQWLPTDEIDTAVIEFKMERYTQEAYANNALLPREKQAVRLHVSVETIEELIVFE